VNRFQPQQNLTEPARTHPGGTRPATTRAAVSRARLRAALLALAALTATAVAAGCTAPAAPAPVASGTAAATPTSASASPAASTSTTGASTATCNVYASSPAPPPGPPQVTPGSFMATIRARGHLVAGVDANTYRFEYFNPRDGSFSGFDIDMIQAVAHAIFGSDITGRIQYKAITDDARTPDVNNGSVDIVAHTYTINCSRLKQVAFSTVYFLAHQQVLVLDSSHATSLNDLGGQKVCATSGSDSVDAVKASPAHPELVTVPYITDCLVMLQQGQVAAITTDNSILEGLEAQDPYTKIIGPPLTDEPYGLAIAKTHPEFVQFVNAVLKEERSSGAWKASYVKWIGAPAPPWPTVGYAS
jgi:polar amino acid transport system substrate-binding protein